MSLNFGAMDKIMVHSHLKQPVDLCKTIRYVKFMYKFKKCLLDFAGVSV